MGLCFEFENFNTTRNQRRESKDLKILQFVDKRRLQTRKNSTLREAHDQIDEENNFKFQLFLEK